MSNIKHTPGKIIYEKGNIVVRGGILEQVSDLIAEVNTSHPAAKANAERIVRCWNSHDDLVAALETCLFQLQKYAELHEWDINDDDAYEAGKLALDTATK